MHGQIPGASVRILVVLRNVRVDLGDQLLCNEKRHTCKPCRCLRHSDDSVGRNGDRNRRWEACSEGGYRYTVAENGGTVRVTHWLIAVVGANGVVVRVGVIRKGRVADAKACTDDRIGMDPVCETDARCEVPVLRSHAQVRRVASAGVACHNQGVIGWVVVREASGNRGSRWRIQLPAQPQIGG